MSHLGSVTNIVKGQRIQRLGRIMRKGQSEYKEEDPEEIQEKMY